MRGKPLSGSASTADTRITPADAGKTSFEDSKLGHVKDHPRGCGENSTAFKPPALPVGSPPRMRGKQGWYVHLMRNGMDHPRGCGENTEQTRSNITNAGSPPRMRGKHGMEDEEIAQAGITPADAGKTIV